MASLGATPVTAFHHVFLSPHFDDAIGSCGGTMWRLSRRGYPVRVLTVFGGDEVLPLSEGALRFHARAGNLRGVNERRIEDGAACRVLGCTGDYLDYSDAIYRRGTHGHSLYNELQAVLRPMAPEDAGLAGTIANNVTDRFSLATSVIYCPMAIGHHVDHVATRDCGRVLLERGANVVFYEDFYHSEKSRGSADNRPIHRYTVSLSKVELAKKLSAFSKYKSQVKLLFGRPGNLRVYFDRHGKDERFASSQEPALKIFEAALS